ncbi:MAG: peptidase S9 prolyl oligopeptidase active site domain-containing protein [Parcubacteria group bacterium Gr01-1014_33]|nr:MAG: peptidase S9 prolyl oligopeptidase active site domain-containing protein [Parcubacteria group bacterium Gr01-1014_33]
MRRFSHGKALWVIVLVCVGGVVAGYMGDGGGAFYSFRSALFRALASASVPIISEYAPSVSPEPPYKTFREGDEYRVQIGARVFAVEIARTAESRSRGLSGRESIADDQGMLFLFENEDLHGFWMRDMKFPIDIVWIRQGRVADIKENVPVPTADASAQELPVYRPSDPADMVLEVAAGAGARFGIKKGDEAHFALNDQGGTEKKDVSLSSDVVKKAGTYFIETLKGRDFQGSDLAIEKRLEENSAYRKFLVSYRAGDRTLTGVINIPLSIPPEGGFPVIILNHGLIDPALYFSGRGSRREQDFFARAGYVTFHPDYRGYGSSPSPDDITLLYRKGIFAEGNSTPKQKERTTTLHHDFYASYAEDTLAAVHAIKNAAWPPVNKDTIGMWGHSMGGGIAARIAVVSPDIKAYVLFASVSADAEDNFYELTEEEVDWLHNTYGEAGSDVYKKISPLAYFKDIAAPIQIHHGTADKDVPVEFSQKMYNELSRLGKKVEFYTYPGQKHEFIEAWPIAAERALQFFDWYVKSVDKS